MGQVHLFPFLYTRGCGGTLRGTGLQYMVWCPDLPPSVLREAERFCVYQKPLELRTEEDPDRLPRSLVCFNLRDGWRGIARQSYARNQSQARGGNVVVSGFFVRDDEMAAVGHDPFAIIRADIPFLTEDDVPETGVHVEPMLVELRERDSIGLSDVETLFSRQSVAANSLGSLLQVGLDTRNRRTLLVGTGSPEDHEALFDFLLGLLPPATRATTPFATYARDARAPYLWLGLVGREAEQLPLRARSQASWVVAVVQGELVLSTHLPDPSAVARLILEAAPTGTVAEVHRRLAPVGASLVGADADLVAMALCEDDAAPGQILRSVEGVEPSTPGLLEVVRSALTAMLVQAEATRSVDEVLALLAWCTVYQSTLPVEELREMVERGVMAMPDDASPYQWHDALGSKVVGRLDSPLPLWSLVGQRIGTRHDRTSGWEQVMELMLRHRATDPSASYEWLRVVRSLLHASAADSATALSAPLERALRAHLPGRDAGECWPPLLEEISGFPAALEEGPAVLLSETWLRLLRTGAAPDVPGSVVHLVQRLALMREAGDRWIQRQARTLGSDLTRRHLLPLFLDARFDTGGMQDRSYGLIEPILRGGGLGEETRVRVRRVLVERGAVPALLADLFRTANPDVDFTLAELIAVDPDALSKHESIIRSRFLRWSLDMGWDSPRRFEPGWRWLCDRPGPSASLLSAALVYGCLSTPRASRSFASSWKSIAPSLRAMHEGPQSSGVSAFVDSMDRLQEARLHVVPGLYGNVTLESLGLERDVCRAFKRAKAADVTWLGVVAIALVRERWKTALFQFLRLLEEMSLEERKAVLDVLCRQLIELPSASVVDVSGHLLELSLSHGRVSLARHLFRQLVLVEHELRPETPYDSDLFDVLRALGSRKERRRIEETGDLRKGAVNAFRDHMARELTDLGGRTQGMWPFMGI